MASRGASVVAQGGWDAVSLGEVMLRFDPGEDRIRTTRSFRVWEGGGEYNVARALRRCFGRPTAVVTAFARDEIGLLLEDLVLQGGVDTSLIRWMEADGIGERTRNGLNFVERGFGVRGPLGVSDRARSAASQLALDDGDWDRILEGGTRWLHTGGVYAGLSETSARTAEAGMRAARRHGATVSFDPNFRGSLWRSRGPEAAAALFRRIAASADLLVGNIGQLRLCLGDPVHPVADPDPEQLVEELLATHPDLRVISGTRRVVHDAASHELSGFAWTPATGVVVASLDRPMAVLDRVGSGDGFAAGLIHGLLDGADPRTALGYGLAHAALVATTPGDTSCVDLAEVAALAGGTAARLTR